MSAATSATRRVTTIYCKIKDREGHGEVSNGLEISEGIKQAVESREKVELRLAPHKFTRDGEDIVTSVLVEKWVRESRSGYAIKAMRKGFIYNLAIAALAGCVASCRPTRVMPQQTRKGLTDVAIGFRLGEHKDDGSTQRGAGHVG